MAGPERWSEDRWSRDRARFGGDRDFNEGYGEDRTFEGRGGTDAYAAGYGIPSPDDRRYGGQWGRGEEAGGYPGQDYGHGDRGGRFGQDRPGWDDRDRDRLRLDAEGEARARNFGSGGGPAPYRPAGDHDRTWMERAGEKIGSWFTGGEGERSHRGKGPKNYTRSDERIRDDVSDRLTDDSWLDASEIEVQVQGGEVTLSGTVTAREDKRRAEDLAEQAPGVRHVQNNLRVRPQSDAAPSALEGAAAMNASNPGGPASV